MELGISIKGDLDIKRTIALAHQVEAAGDRIDIRFTVEAGGQCRSAC